MRKLDSRRFSVIKKHTKRRKQSQTGCFFLLTTGLMLIGLLIANTFFVRTFFRSNHLNLDAGFFNALKFVLPLVMIFIEFWTYDTVVDFFRYRNLDSLKESEDLDESESP